MKKITIIAILLTLFANVFAQEIQDDQVYNKKGIAILPEKGEWVIGIDATPFLDYIGNMVLISDEANEAPEFAFTAQRPGQLFGKYYLQNNKAMRVGLRLGITSFTDKDGNTSNPDEIDKLKQSSLNIGISVGIENYKSIKGRLRGFWGYEAGINKTPYIGMDYFGTDVVTGKVDYEDAVQSDNSYIEEGGNTIEVFAKGIVGIEYFIAPKISLSGEFGIGLSYQNTSERKYNPNIGDTIIWDAGSSAISMSNTASGAFVLLFHF